MSEIKEPARSHRKKRQNELDSVFSLDHLARLSVIKCGGFEMLDVVALDVHILFSLRNDTTLFLASERSPSFTKHEGT